MIFSSFLLSLIPTFLVELKKISENVLRDNPRESFPNILNSTLLYLSGASSLHLPCMAESCLLSFLLPASPWAYLGFIIKSFLLIWNPLEKIYLLYRILNLTFLCVLEIGWIPVISNLSNWYKDLFGINNAIKGRLYLILNIFTNFIKIGHRKQNHELNITFIPYFKNHKTIIKKHFLLNLYILKDLIY